MTIEVITTLVLGWLMGLLAPAISEGIRRARRVSQIKSAVYTEISDLGVKTSLAVLKVEGTLMPWTKELVAWTCEILEKLGTERHNELKDTLTKMLSTEDESFHIMAELKRSKPGTALGVRSHRLPYIDATIGELDVFSEGVRASILDLRGQVDQFNELVVDSRMFYQMTFELTGDNHAVASQNLDASYRDIASKGRVIVSRVLEIVSNRA